MGVEKLTFAVSNTDEQDGWRGRNKGLGTKDLFVKVTFVTTQITAVTGPILSESPMRVHRHNQFIKL